MLVVGREQESLRGVGMRAFLCRELRAFKVVRDLGILCS